MVNDMVLLRLQACIYNLSIHSPGLCYISMKRIFRKFLPCCCIISLLLLPASLKHSICMHCTNLHIYIHIYLHIHTNKFLIHLYVHTCTMYVNRCAHINNCRYTKALISLACYRIEERGGRMRRGENNLAQRVSKNC